MQQKPSPKHKKKLLNRFYGSIRGRISSTATMSNNNNNATTPDTPLTPSKESSFNNGFQFVERPISFDEENDEIISTTYNFKITYLCSSLVKAPLRPKHVRECYKQFTKETLKAEKVSHNCRLNTIGSPVELVIVTDAEVIMLDAVNRNNVIRQSSIELYEDCVMHPDPTMGCFAFSTRLPSPIKSDTKQQQQQQQQQHHHKIHLFTMPLHLKDNIVSSFAEFSYNKKRQEEAMKHLTEHLPNVNQMV